MPLSCSAFYHSGHPQTKKFNESGTGPRTLWNCALESPPRNLVLTQIKRVTHPTFDIKHPELQVISMQIQ